MKTIITRDGKTIKSSCVPLDVTYDRHNRKVDLIDSKTGEKFHFEEVLNERLGWLHIDTTGNDEVLVELTVK
jgi:hypothetical protein